VRPKKNKYNGIFHDLTRDPLLPNYPFRVANTQTSPSDIRDGLSNTLLYTENLTQYLNGTTWDNINDTASGYKVWNVFGWLYALDDPNAAFHNAADPLASTVNPIMKINGGRNLEPIENDPLIAAPDECAMTARPSSEHQGGANVTSFERGGGKRQHCEKWCRFKQPQFFAYTGC